MATRPYIVTDLSNGNARLIEATSQAQALGYVAASAFRVQAATSKEVMDLMMKGIKPEAVKTEAPAPAATGEEQSSDPAPQEEGANPGPATAEQDEPAAPAPPAPPEEPEVPGPAQEEGEPAAPPAPEEPTAPATKPRTAGKAKAASAEEETQI